MLTRGADAEMLRALRNTVRRAGDRVTLRNMSTLDPGSRPHPAFPGRGGEHCANGL